jgi:ribonuclease PH
MTSSSSSLRPDGRSSHSLRPLSCELGGLQNADGSAVWKSGSTHVLASVHGPLAARQTLHEQADRAIVSVVIKSGASSSNSASSSASITYEREWEHVLTQVLQAAIATDAYPRSVIQIVLQILSADGSVLAACVHAAVSALMDAAIELVFLPAASTCLIHKNEESRLQQEDGDTDATAAAISLDPSALEEQSAGTMVVVTTPENRILATHTSFVDDSVQTLLQCCSIAGRAGAAVIAFWRLVMEQKATREAQTIWAS